MRPPTSAEDLTSAQPGSAAVGQVQSARAFLFVPGDRPERFDKAAAAGADVVIVDLEDAVGPEHKGAARDAVVAWLAEGGRAAVRVNAVDSPEHAAEVRELISEVASEADEDELVSAAESAFRANWRLLDGV